MLNAQLINGVMIDWDRITPGSYLKEIEALSGVDRIDFTHPVTFFVGENGSGKSTLLEAIAVAYGFNPEGGTRNIPIRSGARLWIAGWHHTAPSASRR